MPFILSATIFSAHHGLCCSTLPRPGESRPAFLRRRRRLLGRMGTGRRPRHRGLHRLRPLHGRRRRLYRPVHLRRVFPGTGSVARTCIERQHGGQEALRRGRGPGGGRLPRAAPDHTLPGPGTIPARCPGGHGRPQPVERLPGFPRLQYMDRQRGPGEYPRPLHQPPDHRRHHSGHGRGFRHRPVPRPVPWCGWLCLGLCRRFHSRTIGIRKPAPRALPQGDHRRRRAGYAPGRSFASLPRSQIPPRRPVLRPVDLRPRSVRSPLQRLHARPPAHLLYRDLDLQRPFHAGQHRQLPVLGRTHRPLRRQAGTADPDDAGGLPALRLGIQPAGGLSPGSGGPDPQRHSILRDRGGGQPPALRPAAPGREAHRLPGRLVGDGQSDGRSRPPC